MKQQQISSKGLITRCTNYKESDRIFTLISEEEGLMKFIARGAKKPKSKLSGHIEPLNYVNIFYRKGAGLNAVSQVESLNSFLDIKKKYDLILDAQYLMELAENLSVEGEGNTFLFKGLINTLSNIASETNKDIQVMIFEFEILRQQGFGIQVFDCINCNKSLSKSDHFFSSFMGGFLCDACLPANLSGGELNKVSISNQLLFRNIARKNYTSILKTSIPEVDILSVRKLLQKSIRDLMGVQLKTVNFQL